MSTAERHTTWPGFIGSKLLQAGRTAAYIAISTFHSLNDAEGHYVPGAPYSTVRHTRAWVYYQGTATTVPISILGRKPLPDDARITLQRRGWRTGLLGWTLGGWLGGTLGKETDVTPAATGRWADLDAKRRTQYEREVRDFVGGADGALQDHRVRATGLVHIPVAAGDGYFRLLVRNKGKATATGAPPGGSVLASSATFRVGSLSLASAHPRGASPLALAPELVLKSASLTLSAAAWAGFYTAFPFLKVAEMVPGTSAWGRWALRRAYILAGGDQRVGELRERYRVDERTARAQDTLYRTVPFGSMGVRTVYDLEEDAKMGRGGILFPRGAE